MYSFDNLSDFRNDSPPRLPCQFFLADVSIFLGANFPFMPNLISPDGDDDFEDALMPPNDEPPSFPFNTPLFNIGDETPLEIGGGDIEPLLIDDGGGDDVVVVSFCCFSPIDLALTLLM